jgi:hypothetical protein
MDSVPVDFNFLQHISLGAIGCLLLVTALPGGRSASLLAPWELALMPGSTNFLALIMIPLAISIHRRPMNAGSRTTYRAIMGGLIVLCAIMLGFTFTDGGLFDGQPAIRNLFGRGIAPSLTLILVMTTLGSALFWRHLKPSAAGPGVAVMIGVILTGLTATAGHLMGLGETVPFQAFLDATDSAYSGDGAAGVLMLVLIGLSFVSLIAVFKGKWSRHTSLYLAMLIPLTPVLALTVLILFSYTALHWYLVLEPLKMTFLLLTGLILLSAAVGTMLAERPERV